MMVKKPKQTVVNGKSKSDGVKTKGKRKRKPAKKKSPVLDKVKIKSEFDNIVIKKEPLEEVSLNIKVEDDVAKQQKSKAGSVSKTSVKKATGQKARNNNNNNKRNLPSKGVVYVEHLPHGFYEDQLQSYFAQFGPVSGVYVPRSKVTGRARGYGFIEFSHPEVARIAAETMQNYLMFDKLLKTKLVPPEQQKPHMFMHKYKELKAGNVRNAAIQRRNRKVKDSKVEDYIKNATKRLVATKRKLKSLGCDYSILVKDSDGSVSPSKVSKLSAECEVSASPSNVVVPGKKNNAATLTKIQNNKTKKSKNKKNTDISSSMLVEAPQEKKKGKKKGKKGNKDSAKPSVDSSNPSIPLKNNNSKKVTNETPVPVKEQNASTNKKSKKGKKQTPTPVKLQTPTEKKNETAVPVKNQSASTNKKSKKGKKQTPTPVKLQTPTEKKRKRTKKRPNTDSSKPKSSVKAKITKKKKS